MHQGEVVPSVAVLSHSEQLDRLRKYAPEAADVALVAGDPCFDRMLASRPLRETYRAALGAGPEQRIVMISSTWGDASLFGRDPSLIVRLARHLPMDEYRIVVALHPNIWHGHTPWQVRMWLTECARSGVVVLPPREGWRAALVAADITLGDHGSVAFYSAALGTPLLLAAWPEDALDADSPVARLLTVAPRLDPHHDFPSQIESTISSHSPAHYAPVTSLTTSVPGESASILRREVYDRLGLDEPETPAEPAAVPTPEVTPTRSDSQLVATDLNHDDRENLTATVTRYPAEALRDPERLPTETILVAGTDEPHRRWLELAEVLVHDGPCPDARHWIRTSLAALPGCLLGAVRCETGCWLVGDAEGSLVRFTGPADLGPAYGGIVHAWLSAGHGVRELPDIAHILLGTRRATARVEVLSTPQ